MTAFMFGELAVVQFNSLMANTKYVLFSSAGERLGRKKTFMIGITIMSIGAILQFTAFSVAQMIVARLVTGTIFLTQMC